MKNTFKGQKTFVGGVQGSGKTYFTKWLVKKKFRKGIGVRLTPDFDDVENITLVQTSGDVGSDVEQVAGELIKDGKKVMEGEKRMPGFDVFVVDEADLIFRNNFDLGPNMQNLILMHRHYKIGLVFITRRPQDIPAKFIESCMNLIFFKLEGKNVFQRLDNIHPKLRDMVESLRYQKHDFVYKQLGEDPIVHKPVKL